MESRKRMGKKKKKGKAKHEKKILSDFRQQHQNSSGLLNSSSLMSSLTPFYNGENFELSQLLRRLDKKDATTRAKNLDRLREIVETCKPKEQRDASPLECEGEEFVGDEYGDGGYGLLQNWVSLN